MPYRVIYNAHRRQHACYSTLHDYMMKQSKRALSCFAITDHGPIWLMRRITGTL